MYDRLIGPGPAWLERSPDWPIERTETPWPDAADADKVLDGDYYSHWNPNGQGPWYIIFDLVAPYTLSKISITNNGDTTHDVSMFLLEASASSDPYSWKDVVTVKEVAASSEVQEFGGFSATGRFWKLNITKTYGTWQPWLREVNFFGERAETDCYSPGLEIAIHHGVTLQFCAEACCAASSCLSFQYNTGSSCYLKTKLCSDEEKTSTASGNMYDWFQVSPTIGSESPDHTSHEYTSLGCWSDSADRAIPTLEGTDPRLDGKYRKRTDPIGKCYQVAYSRGFTVFAVQDSGQCFGSADAHNTYNKHGPSIKCKADGEGGPWAIEVYQITVDGSWSEWTSWSICEVECGLGNQSRRRVCDSLRPQGSGANCTGHSGETQGCDTGLPCPVSGNWSQWTSWSSCDVTCGFGNQSRGRSCDNPPPQHGGANCTGSSAEVRTCDSGKPCAVSGNWSLWTSWSSCDVTCGVGNQSRGRSCDNPPPQHGGANCTGSSSEVRTCDSRLPCAVSGNWSHWTSWSSCDVTCGFGNQSRNRSCDNPPPQHGGANCTGSSAEVRTCDSGQPCAGQFPGTGLCGLPGPVVTSRVDSVTSRAAAVVTTPLPNMAARTVPEVPLKSGPATAGSRVQWNSWSACDVTCGVGHQTRNRSCNNPEPLHGGANCTGISEDRKPCDNLPPCAVDGVWSPWTVWSACDVTCGVGHQTRNRSCDNPEPLHGGANCTGTSEDRKPCDNLPPCAVAGVWSPWTVWSNCSVTCGNGERTRRRTCDHPPPQHGGANCTGNASQSQACGQDQACYVAYSWSEWTPWSVCTVTCGAGNQTRYRTCNTAAGNGSVANCTGDALQTRACMDIGPCPGPQEPHSTSTAGPTVAQTTPSPDPLAPSDGGTMEEFARWETGEALPDTYDAQESPVDMAKADSPADTFSTLEARLHFRRRLPYYILRVYTPTATVVAVSWMSFWVHYTETSARVALGCTTFLMLVRLSSQIEKMPHISYIRAIDLWYMFCLAFAFMVILEYAVVHHLHNPQNKKVKQNEREETQVRADIPASREENSTVVSLRKRFARAVNEVRVRQVLGRNRVRPSLDSTQPVPVQSSEWDLIVPTTSKHTSETSQLQDERQEGDNKDSREAQSIVIPSSKRFTKTVNQVRSTVKENNCKSASQASKWGLVIPPTSRLTNTSKTSHTEEDNGKSTQEDQPIVISPSKRFTKAANQVRPTGTVKKTRSKSVGAQPTGWGLLIPPSRLINTPKTSQQEEDNGKSTQDQSIVVPSSKRFVKAANQCRKQFRQSAHLKKHTKTHSHTKETL
ncbi:PREDICTED: uncharacterized protein LOC109479741 [Branchiostoma belcheri]|uniref:Uncharacterized protein LOC109479741 n=1 Tax=Branchiostoma belcheri TaxID=7741 RepID=A0A6P4ZT66_BRABE|nr:PREDICTED: uncharacterized protein LOC109479741 [Branchiostoma belcheri]